MYRLYVLFANDTAQGFHLQSGHQEMTKKELDALPIFRSYRKAEDRHLYDYHYSFATLSPNKTHSIDLLESLIEASKSPEKNHYSEMVWSTLQLLLKAGGNLKSAKKIRAKRIP